jgi:hypothetical protein
MTTEVSGYSERIERTAEENREERAAVNSARHEQALRSLRYVSDNVTTLPGNKTPAYLARPADGPILGELIRHGWVERTVVPNPAGAWSSAARDRVEIRLTEEGHEALANREESP